METIRTLVTRMLDPTPGFFKKMRNIGLIAGAIGTAIIGAPVALPVVVTKIAGYLAVAGAVAGVVSQTAVKNDL